ncbi:MAG: putative sodium/hydrogen exchanger [Phycisphaerales bacterium]|nr:putative sodium/hydrogen exchanger [Phycisphaerales bacterium]
MTLFQILATLITLAALFSYINYRFLRLPQTIGVMVVSLGASLLLFIAGQFIPAVYRDAQTILDSIDFNQALLHGMLGFLLFAGALHLNLSDLHRHRAVILTLATVGVLISTALVGLLTWLALHAMALPIPFIHCLLFGALISPTDPIAVLAIMKRLGAPKDLETQICGESLFNDGIGVVVFLAVLAFAGGPGAHAGESPGIAHVVLLFLRESLGGAIFGMAIGLIAYHMLKRIDQYQVEILISLALVTGGYALAERLYVSGPIAMVIAGLFIGNHGRAFAMSPATRERLDHFWELIDEILNAVLFVLIGLQVLVIQWQPRYFLAGLVAIVIVLAARLISVGLPIRALRPFAPIPRHAVRLLTWGGLRGGISVALALSLRSPRSTAADPHFDLLLVMTYVVVVFSIGVQGLTIASVLRTSLR